MKVICNSIELSEACQNVQRAASTKTAIPAIEGILMVAENNILTLTGYDLEMGITTSIPRQVKRRRVSSSSMPTCSVRRSGSCPAAP